ncbi:MAG: uracil-DNA glycosylase [Gemmatimonadetes bacterium]|nr:uracil-DNA glycosylase [Gemmatimonadota bacterium]
MAVREDRVSYRACRGRGAVGCRSSGDALRRHRHGQRPRGTTPDRVTAEAGSFEALQARIVGCRRCPRLVAWRERVAREKRAAFRDGEYWGRPVPAFGDPRGRVAVVGLAPAAHGANRTGRMFTGDRSGDWLFRALHRAGFANQSEAVDTSDGLELNDLLITAAVRCAPPQNKPSPRERDRCAPWLLEELNHLSAVRVVVCLGGFAYVQTLRILGQTGATIPRPRPRFGHGVEVEVDNGPTVLCSYHPSQQNTFTGKLTEKAFDDIWARARALADGSSAP